MFWLLVSLQVLRGKATEPAGVRKAQGGFDDVFEKGTYVCAGMYIKKEVCTWVWCTRGWWGERSGVVRKKIVRQKQQHSRNAQAAPSLLTWLVGRQSSSSVFVCRACRHNYHVHTYIPAGRHWWSMPVPPRMYPIGNPSPLPCMYICGAPIRPDPPLRMPYSSLRGQPQVRLRVRLARILDQHQGRRVRGKGCRREAVRDPLLGL